MNNEELQKRIQMIVGLLEGLSLQEAVNVLFSVTGSLHQQLLNNPVAQPKSEVQDGQKS